MDPMMLMHLMGQLPGYGQSQNPMAQGQLPSMGQPQMGQPQPTPQMGQQGDQSQQHGGHHGLSPWMALSPLGGLFASNPKQAAMFGISPLASMLGAFK